jgi:nucleotide-binding universal stress UspA family protein
MFKKILLPVDLQEESSWQNALPVALRMAKDDGAELHILTVVPPLPGQIYGYFPEDFEPKMIDQGKAAIEAFAKEHAGGTKVVPHLAQGQPYSAIIDLAEKISADLIVMGSHRPELKDYLLGPNAARVVRHASCSVMVVRK